MSPREKAELRTAIRSSIDELQRHSRMTTKSLVDTVMDRYPELVDAARTKLVREAIAKWARQAMKKEAESEIAGQAVLPLEVKGLGIPSSICLPVKNEDDESEIEWVPLSDATFEELEVHISYMRGQIAADMNRLKKLEQLHDVLAPHMADDHREEAIGPVLHELALAEQRPRRA